ncbi:hypothetical protein SDC9_178511 [bioreactor metagenome]|uniref:Uncharacterized protein n=1 Tax=bioreactor metagenome TaxID=1076179 RepID=A0A645GXE3_9ZZZZ
MGDKAQRVHLVPVEEQVHLNQLAGTIVLQLVIQRGVALGASLEGVKKVVDDLPQRHGVVQLHQIGIQVLHILKLPPPVLAQGHDIAHIVGRGNNRHLGVRFLRLGNGAGVGVVVGVIHHDHLAVGLDDFVDHGRERGDEIQIKFPLQPFLDNLHVQKAQETATETKAQGE